MRNRLPESNKGQLLPKGGEQKRSGEGTGINQESRSPGRVMVMPQVQAQAGKPVHRSRSVLARPAHSNKTDSSKLGPGAHGQSSDKDGSPVLSLEGAALPHMRPIMVNEADGAHRDPTAGACLFKGAPRSQP